MQESKYVYVNELFTNHKQTFQMSYKDKEITMKRELGGNGMRGKHTYQERRETRLQMMQIIVNYLIDLLREHRLLNVGT